MIHQYSVMLNNVFQLLNIFFTVYPIKRVIPRNIFRCIHVYANGDHRFSSIKKKQGKQKKKKNTRNEKKNYPLTRILANI